MATVKQLIEQLQEIEDQGQTVVFQYFVAEHFIDPTTDDNMTPALFTKLVEHSSNRVDQLWEDATDRMYEILGEADAETADESRAAELDELWG